MKFIQSTDGTRIAFQTKGSGPALIIIDGAFCYSSYGPASSLSNLLEKDFTVYTYDRRGRGESANELPYSIDKEVDDLLTLIKVTGESPFVFGMSSGGALLLQTLVKSAAIKKAALFEPPYVARSKNEVSFQQAQYELVSLLNDHDRSGAVRYFMNRLMKIPGIIVFILKLFNRSMWKKNEAVAHTLPYDLELMKDNAVLIRAADTIAIPVLIMGGEKSPASMKAAVQNVTKSIKKGSMRILKGEGHNVAVNVLAPELISFFKSA